MGSHAFPAQQPQVREAGGLSPKSCCNLLRMYWITEFMFDGFRFDGVTSILYDWALALMHFVSSHSRITCVTTATRIMASVTLSAGITASTRPQTPSLFIFFCIFVALRPTAFLHFVFVTTRACTSVHPATVTLACAYRLSPLRHATNI